MAFIIYLLMMWGIISSPADITDQIISDNWDKLRTEIIIDDDIQVK